MAVVPVGDPHHRRESGTGAIEARGGDGPGTICRAGGGGRIALFTDSLGLPSANLLDRRGNSTGNFFGSAGTIYLKSASTAPDLIIDNTNLAGTLYTPLRTLEPVYRTLVLRNRGRADISSADVTSIMIEEPVHDDGIIRIHFEFRRHDGSDGACWI